LVGSRRTFDLLRVFWAGALLSPVDVPGCLRRIWLLVLRLLWPVAVIGIFRLLRLQILCVSMLSLVQRAFEVLGLLRGFAPFNSVPIGLMVSRTIPDLLRFTPLHGFRR